MDREVKNSYRQCPAEVGGATVFRRDHDLTVMQDPEGNEFCVEPGHGLDHRRHTGHAIGRGRW
jgi:hypothetical protein